MRSQRLIESAAGRPSMGPWVTRVSVGSPSWPSASVKKVKCSPKNRVTEVRNNLVIMAWPLFALGQAPSTDSTAGAQKGSGSPAIELAAKSK